MSDQLILPSPIGPLCLSAKGDVLVGLGWRSDGPYDTGSAILRRAAQQLQEYFAGTRSRFDLALAPQGTPFRQSVWRAMQDIPCGAVVTYGDIARQIQSAPRAVGGACGANPIAVIIPCHRVVGHARKLTGYSGGGGLDTKLWLLKHEEIFA